MFKNNIDHRDRETCVIFGLPIHNKNSAINGLLPFFFDFTSYRKDRFLGNKWNDDQTLIEKILCSGHIIADTLV